MTEEELFELSDEDLEAAAAQESNAQQAEEDIPNDGEQENVDDGEPTEEDVADSDVGDIEPDDEPDDEVNGDDTETSEEEVEQPQENNEASNEGSNSDESDDNTPDTPTQEFAPLKVSGKYIPINSMEELYTLASGGAAVTQKLQAISGHKKAIAIMENQGLSEVDLSLLAEIKRGSKDALASLIKESGIDSMDITDEISDGYNPGRFIPDDRQLSLQEVQKEISVDKEYALTQNLVNNFLDPKSQEMVVERPELIRGLHEDIKSGAYDYYSGHAQKLKLMDGGRRSDIEYYIEAVQGADNTQPQMPLAQQGVNITQEQEPKKAPVDKSKKRSAASNRQKTRVPSIKDIENMSDDELMSYREKIMERY